MAAFGASRPVAMHPAEGPSTEPTTATRPRGAGDLRRHRPSARGFAEHDPAAAAWRGECRQRGLCPNLDLAAAGGAAELLDAVGVHGRAGAPVPQIAAARAEGVRSLDPDIAGVELEGIA